MRLLTFLCHEAYLYDMARLGEPMDVVVDLPGHHATRWDARMRPVPENVREVGLRVALAARDRYDLVVAHNLTELLATKTLALPKILVLHSSLEGRIEQEGGRHRPADYAAALRQYVGLVKATVMIISESKRASWGLDGARVLPNAIDDADYGGWTGEVVAGLRVANHVTQKARYLDWALHEMAMDGIPWRLVGVNPDRPGVSPADGWNDLRDQLRRHRFYVHTATPGREDGYNMAMLEAMATGMPVLCSAHPTSPVEDGVSGFVANDGAVLRDGAKRLLADRALAARLGAAARRTVQERFAMSDFLAGWRELLREAQERFAGD